MFRRNGKSLKFLLLHYKSGHWDFPKGHVEKGESDEETLRREVAEETGIENLEIIPRFTRKVGYFYVAKGEEKKKRIMEKRGIRIKKQVVYYLVETLEEKIVISHEHIDFRWLNFAQACQKITYKNSRNILISANKFIQRASFT